MALEENQGGFQGGPAQMFPVDEVCSKCGNKITELPFKPDPARKDRLLCRDCHKEKMQGMRGRRPFPGQE